MASRAPQKRKTKQRTAIRNVIANGEHPMTIEELHVGAQRQVKRLGIATVYRTVRALVDEGDVVPVEVPGEALRYEASGKGHHHHFHCRQCGKVFEIHGCAKAIESLAPRGYKVEGHDVTLVGKCADCSRRGGR